MNILALETTDKVASVAIYRSGECFEKEISSSLRHEETVMPAVDELFREAGMIPRDLSAVAVDVGPGSFTGVRIGVCHGNAIASALKLPIISVNALEALAYPFLGCGSPVAAIIDARNGNGYGALYDPAGRTLIAPRAIEIASFMEELPENAVMTGTGFPDSDGAVPTAKNIACIGAQRSGDKTATPVYLRPSQAERKHGL